MAFKHANVRDKNYSLAVPGIYQFVVDGVTRSWESGNSQMAPHDKYLASIKVICDDGDRDVDDTFEDIDKYNWKFGKFFVAIGAVQPSADGDVGYDPEWMEQVKGRTGYVRLTNNSYKTKQDETRWSNRINYLDPAKVDPTTIGPTPGATLPPEYVAQQAASAPAEQPQPQQPMVAQQYATVAPAPAAAPQPAQMPLPTMGAPAPMAYAQPAVAYAQPAQTMPVPGAAQPTDEIPF